MSDGREHVGVANGKGGESETNGGGGRVRVKCAVMALLPGTKRVSVAFLEEPDGRVACFIETVDGWLSPVWGRSVEGVEALMVRKYPECRMVISAAAAAHWHEMTVDRRGRRLGRRRLARLPEEN